MQQLEELQSQLIQAKFDFDSWLALLREDQVYEVGRNTTLFLHPAHYWTHLAGKRYVDIIGRVENFESDLQGLQSHLGIEVTERVSVNVKEANVGSEDLKYIERMSRISVDKINTLFKEDFDLLGYERR